VESLAHEFELYGSVQGSAVGHVEMKCFHDLDEATKLAADSVQLKSNLTSPPAACTAAAASAAVPRSINGSTLPSLCKFFLHLTPVVLSKMLSRPM